MAAERPSGGNGGQRKGAGPAWQSSLQDAGPYLTIGIQLAGTMIVYVIGGYLIDRWLETTPIFLIVGAVLGMVAFFYQIVRLTRDLNEKSRAAKREKGDANSGDGSIHS
ncbi:MAG: AtpZ/AtpI family protein [Rhodothermales bacterium]|nr:AtpZ/AtpI family protein [Rhodothermales bacterium]